MKKQIENERDLFIYWLLQTYRTIHRGSHEDGLTDRELSEQIYNVLCNVGYDPNLSLEAKQLLEAEPKHFIETENHDRMSPLEATKPFKVSRDGKRVKFCDVQIGQKFVFADDELLKDEIYTRIEDDGTFEMQSGSRGILQIESNGEVKTAYCKPNSELPVILVEDAEEAQNA